MCACVCLCACMEERRERKREDRGRREREKERESEGEKDIVANFRPYSLPVVGSDIHYITSSGRNQNQNGGGF